MIADLKMTFNETVGESEVDALLSEVTKDGKLGKFEVTAVLVGASMKGNIIRYS